MKLVVDVDSVSHKPHHLGCGKTQELFDVKIISPEVYSSFFIGASTLIKDVKDTSFLACAIALKCSLWSNDKGFKKQNKVNVFTTKELLDELS